MRSVGFAGVSTKMPADQQAKRLGDAWEQIQDERKRTLRVLKLINPDGTERVYELGAHRPYIRPVVVDLNNRLWLELTRENENLHHNQIVSLALRRLAEDLASKKRAEVVTQVKDLK